MLGYDDKKDWLKGSQPPPGVDLASWAVVIAQCRVAEESAPPLMGIPMPAPWLTASQNAGPANPSVTTAVPEQPRRVFFDDEDLPDESEV